MQAHRPIGSVMRALTRDGDKTFLISIQEHPNACAREAKVAVCFSQFAPAKPRPREARADAPHHARSRVAGRFVARRVAFTSVAD
jgi:hypothetical protein